MKKENQNFFLNFRRWLENTISNKIKGSTGSDLFDWLSLFFLFGGGSVLVFFAFWKGVIEIDDFVSAFVLWFTAFAIFRYTKETYYLKKLQQKQLEEAQKQTDFAMKPFLRLQWVSDHTWDVFQIVNIGKGIAVDIEFEDFNIAKTRFSIDKRPAMSAESGTSSVTGDELLINCEGNVNRNVKSFIESELKGMAMSQQNFYLKAKYKDIEGHEYKVIFKYDEKYNDKFVIEYQDLITEERETKKIVQKSN